MSSAREYTVAVVGQEEIGKTRLVEKLTNQKSDPNYKKTLGVNFALYTLSSGNKLQIWDTGGNERSQQTTSSLFRWYVTPRDGVIICFDLSQQGADAIDDWVNFIKEDLPTQTVLMLLNLQANAGEAENLLREKAEEHSIDLYFTVDIEKNINVQEAFQVLERKLLEKQQKASNISSSSSLVQQMERIYNALFDGQTTSFKKVSHWEDIIKDANDPEEQLQKIKEHAEKAPHSRTAQVMKLQDDHPAWDQPEHDNYKEHRKKLIIRIYNWAHEKSGLFKKPAQDLESKPLSEIEQLAKDKPNSRLGKIVGCLNVRIISCLNVRREIIQEKKMGITVNI